MEKLLTRIRRAVDRETELFKEDAWAAHLADVARTRELTASELRSLAPRFRKDYREWRKYKIK